MEDRRHATTERITALTDEIGTTEARLGKLRSDLHAELGNRAASMAAKAVVRPLEMFGAKQEETDAKLDDILSRLTRMEQREREIHVQMADRLSTLDARLSALEAGGDG